MPELPGAAFSGGSHRVDQHRRLFDVGFPQGAIKNEGWLGNKAMEVLQKDVEGALQSVPRMSASCRCEVAGFQLDSTRHEKLLLSGNVDQSHSAIAHAQ